MLVADSGEEGADGDVHCIGVNQDLDQSPEEPKASFTDEDKHRSII
jgi:hypothetical protein